MKKNTKMLFVLALMVIVTICILAACDEEGDVNNQVTPEFLKHQMEGSISNAINASGHAFEINYALSTIDTVFDTDISTFDTGLIIASTESYSIMVFRNEEHTDITSGVVDLSYGPNVFYIVATSGETTSYYTLRILRELPHVHTFGEWEWASYPTCTAEGLMRRTCECGEKEEQTMSAYGHDYGDWFIYRVPDCETSGISRHECSRCGAYEEEVLQPYGHSFVHHDAQSATCTEIGWDEYDTCLECSMTTYEEIPALGHDLIHHNAQAPTCTSIGWYEYDTCSRCNYSTYVEIPALEHDITYHDAQAATCTAIGWYAYETCSRCDYTTYEEIPALGHNLVHRDAQEPNCYYPGWYEYDECTRCDYSTRQQRSALGHDYIHHDAQLSTCTSVGWYEYDTCSRCDYSSYEETPALGHNLVHHDAQAPTCTSVGWDAYDSCTRCDYTTYHEIPALGHNLVHHNAQAATCTVIGWDAYDTCSRCDYTTYHEIPALGHNLVHHDAQAPTCASVGWDAYDSCSRCSYTTYHEIPALGHSLTHHAGHAATCTEIGWDAYDTCSICDYTSYHEIPALGHNLVHHDAQAPTCTFVGWDAYDTCSRCDYTTYEEIDALGHDYHVDVTEPTETEEGYNIHTCSRCGDSYIIYVSPMKATGLLFQIQNDTAKVIGLTGSQTEIVITSTYNGLPVTEIANEAFKDHTAFRSIWIPTSVTSIGEKAFSGCTSLESIIIPDSVTYIGSTPFAGCSSLVSMTIPYLSGTLGNYFGKDEYEGGVSTSQGSYTYYIPNSLRSVTVTGGNIANYCFKNCSGLTNIVIPDNITTISNEAFYNCSSITSINIPATVTELGSSAFYNCSSLTSISIPASVTEFGSYAFIYCRSLNAVYYGGNIKSWLQIDFAYPGASSYSSNPLYYAHHLYINNTLVNSIVVPDGITQIKPLALAGWRGNTLTCYVSEASDVSFVGCSIENAIVACNICPYINNDSLRTLEIQEGVSFGSGWTIPAYALYGCYSLISVKIPNYVTGIGAYAFSYCISLARVTIGDGNSQLETIGNGAFDNCYHLVEVINYSSLEITKGSSDYGGIGLYAKNIATQKGYVSRISVDNNGYVIYTDGGNKSLIEYIGNNTELTLPANITEINRYAFRVAQTIRKVIMPDTVTYIGEYAFESCRHLTSITIGSGVTNIETFAFADCNRITEVYNKSSLNIDLPDIKYYCTENYVSRLSMDNDGYVIYTYGDEISLIDYLGDDRELNLPANVTDISSHAFIYLNIDSVVIPESVVDINAYAFYGTHIDEIVFAEHGSLRSIMDFAFANNDCTSIVIPDGVVYIGGSAFSGCEKLTNISVPSSVQRVDMNAFGGNPKLQYNEYDNAYYLGNENNSYVVLVKAKDTSITSCNIHPNTRHIIYHAFYNCTSLTNVSFGDDSQVINIEMNAFENCTSLSGVSFGVNAHLEKIGYGAFRECTSLLSFEFPASTKTIGDYAFYDCTSLNQILFADDNSLQTISRFAFYNCDSLESISFGTNSQLTTIDSLAFGYCDSLTNIVLPDGVIIDGTSPFSNSPIMSATIPATACSAVNILNTLQTLILTSGDIPDRAFYNRSSLVSVAIADSITSIGSEAFSGCGLTNLSIGANSQLVSIRDRAFSGTSIRNVFLPSTVEAIGEYAFYRCRFLTSITIPNNIASIGDRAFADCWDLAKLTLGSSVESIGESTFVNCYSLVEIYNLSSLNIIAGSSDYGQIGLYAKYICTENYVSRVTIDANDYVTYTDLNNEVYLLGYVGYSTELTLPSGITKIASYALYSNNNITSVTIPNTVKQMGGYIFALYGTIQTVIFAEGSQLTSIEENCFYGCNRLAEIKLPGGLVSIAANAFYVCFAMQYIVLPNTVATIEQNAFYSCSNLKKVYYKGTQTEKDGISINDTVMDMVATWYYYSATQPEDSGNYWHYDTDGETILIWE